MARVLLVEDHSMLAGAVSHELTNEYGHRVSWVPDPPAMRQAITSTRYDVVVVDLLYEHLNRRFDERRTARPPDIYNDELLVTGLTAIHTLSTLAPQTAAAVWSSGEANRRLHLLFAYEDLKVRVFCSKSSGTGRVDSLHAALQAALRGEHWTDPVLNVYLPTGRARRLSEILLREPQHRAIWRAIALGAHSRREIAQRTHYSVGAVGNGIPAMYDELLEFDQGMARAGPPLSELIGFAAMNWQFFLDDAVRARYP
jgi:DNA-binding NarL/FixJ family response regulator